MKYYTVNVASSGPFCTYDVEAELPIEAVEIASQRFMEEGGTPSEFTCGVIEHVPRGCYTVSAEMVPKFRVKKASI